VQFPGALTPLHIFEPRYRKMLEDALAADRTFGIVYQSQSPGAATKEISVGCSVEIIDHTMLPDGRSNILCRGIRRFRVEEYLDGEPYLRARIGFFDDETPSSDLGEQVARVSDLLRAVVALGQRLGDELPGVDSSGVDLPAEAELLSLIVCSYVNVDLDEKQKLLEMLDTAARLEIAGRWLEKVLIEYERRLFAKEVAGKNGHHGPFSMDI
jgi:Lon protease-like protein